MEPQLDNLIDSALILLENNRHRDITPKQLGEKLRLRPFQTFRLLAKLEALDFVNHEVKQVPIDCYTLSKKGREHLHNNNSNAQISAQNIS